MLDEAGAGNPTAAQERLTLIEDFPLLDIRHPDVQTLADLVAAYLSIAGMIEWPMASGRNPPAVHVPRTTRR